MRNEAQGFFRARIARALGAQAVRRLARREDGAAAVEFGMVAAPFVALLFAILETALVFFGGQVLETATQDASRLIMTGQAQRQGFDRNRFKTEICARILGIFDCQNGVQVDVRRYQAFVNANLDRPVDANGNLDTSGFTYQPGQAGDIVVVRVVYEWPVIVRNFGLDLADMPNGKRLMMSTASFRNEPFN